MAARWRRLAFLVLAVLVSVGAVRLAVPAQAGGAAERCHAEVVCAVGSRGYHALVPDGWDGTSKLPVLMHFHGWKRQGDLIVKHGRIAGATRETGVLLIAPNGLGRSWDFWQADTDDVPFARAVLADVARRWPVDEERIFVSGYSWGSSMAWRFTCAEGSRVAALLAISGTLPNQDEDCAGPVHVRHVHGRSDTVMDYPFGPDGDETFPVALWRAKNECTGEPDRISSWSVPDKYDFKRYEWEDCASGRTVILDVHDKGHFIPIGWIRKQLDELL